MKKFCLSLLVVACIGCGRTVITPPDLHNKDFPRVNGNNLQKSDVVIPDSYRGKPTVLLVGYLQKAQFDIDRWILGILQADITTQIVEVPTIEGMMPQMVQGFINNGMRSGIPESDWASVVTVYGDASKIIDTIGNERPQNAHVVLLNKDGQIMWSSNIGYSATQVLELKKVVDGLATKG